MYQNILVPLDGSELAECVLPHIEAIAKLCRSTVELVRVVEPIEIPTRGEIALDADELKQMQLHGERDARGYLKTVSRRLSESGIRTSSRIITGKPAECLVDYVHKRNFELIIMATHGRSGISRWIFGSVADRLLRSSSIPVLLVRPPGCVPASQS